jgi:hypothetical protein
MQDDFDTRGMLLYGGATAVGGGVNKGMLKLRSQRLKDDTEKTDTVSFDNWRIASSLVGSLSTNWTLNGLSGNESIDGYAAVQDKVVMGAITVGYFRIGRGG